MAKKPEDKPVIIPTFHPDPNPNPPPARCTECGRILGTCEHTKSRSAYSNPFESMLRSWDHMMASEVLS